MKRFTSDQPLVVRESIFKWPVIILTVALCVPLVRAFWKAIDHIPADGWATIGIILIGMVFLLFIAAGTVAIYLWIRQPGQQLPDWAAPIERKFEGG